MPPVISLNLRISPGPILVALFLVILSDHDREIILIRIVRKRIIIITSLSFGTNSVNKYYPNTYSVPRFFFLNWG